MAAVAEQGAPKRSLLASPAVMALSLLLFILGIMGTMVGGMLLGLCLVGGGILCSGTMIGGMGTTAFLLGLPLLIVGIALFVPGRRRFREQNRARLQAMAQRNQSAQLNAMRLELRPAEPGGLVVSKCPDCGAPVRPGASSCEFCGAMFQ